MNTPYDPTPFGPTALDDPAEWAAEWESYMAANAAAAGQYRAMPTSFNRRLIAANGRTVWTTEVYQRRKGAENAICVLTGCFIRRLSTHTEVDWQGNREYPTEVRYVDERGAA